MPQIEVLVKSKETGDTRVLTYKTFLDVEQDFELIGQSDSEGNLIPGSPNLNPRHQRTQASESVVVHAADPGDQITDVSPTRRHEVEPETIQAINEIDAPREKRKYTKRQPA
jgi:hypothetical protein